MLTQVSTSPKEYIFSFTFYLFFRLCSVYKCLDLNDENIVNKKSADVVELGYNHMHHLLIILHSKEYLWFYMIACLICQVANYSFN